jgi:dolichyl-phosphate-mannose-protein mannosyltransferase
VRTLAPTVAGGDSGELITAAFTLGVAHPPGYPLYTMLAKLFTLIPIGTIAWRVNLFSATCGAGAATILFVAAARWSGSLWAALAAASLFAFSRRVWPHAVTAEVFALNNLFSAGLVYLTVRFSEAAANSGHRDDELRTGLIAGALFFWIGLGLTNHHTLIFYAIPAALLVLTNSPAMRTPRQLGIFALCGFVGLLPYAYIPIASRRVPLMSWGDQTTVSGFLDHLLRREYGTFRLGVQEQAPNLTERLAAYLSGSFADLFWIVPLLAIAGLVLIRRRRDKALLWCWVGAFFFFLFTFNALANGPLEPGVSRFVEGRFWQQPHLLLCVFAGLGLAAVAERLGTLGIKALPVVAVAIAIAQPLMNFRGQDKRGAVQIHDFLKDILDSTPSQALLLETGDYIYHGLRYLQIVEGVRTDVRVLDQMVLAYPWHQRLAQRYFPDIKFPGARLLPHSERSGDYGMKAFFDANRDRHPIYLCDVNLWDDARASYTPWPSGLVDSVLPTPQLPTVTTWIDAARASFDRVPLDALRQAPVDSWENVALKYYWKQMGKHALSLARWGGEHGDRTALKRAAALMETMLASWPEAPAEIHRDLGIVYQQLAPDDASLLVPMRREFEAYLRNAPISDPSVPAIREILTRMK